MKDLDELIAELKIQDSGKLAKLVSKWLAINVMGWKYTDDEVFKGYLVPCDVSPDGLLAHNMWQPFTSADHVRLLVREVFVDIDVYTTFDHTRLEMTAHYGQIYQPHYELDPYNDNIAHDSYKALLRLRNCGILSEAVIEQLVGETI